MKTALITGGNRGIGLETAAQLERLGYQVLIGSRSRRAEKAAAQLQSRGHKNVGCVQLDVESDDSVKKAAEVVKERFNGKLDALINNAGVSAAVDPRSDEANLEATRRCYEVNVLGTMRVTNHFLELVKQSPAGRIVNVSSIMGSLELCSSDLTKTAYCSSKAAVNMFTRNLAKSLEGTPIKVNAGHPGWVKTDMGGAEAPLGVEEGAETSVYLATLPDDGPTGGFFHKKERLAW
eukprot:gene11934-8214_t